MTGLGYFLNAFSKQNFLNFDGRARRSEFGWFVLVSWLISIALNFFGVFAELLILDTLAKWLSLASILFSVISFLPALGLTARRLHDLGHSGWWMIAPFLIGLSALIILLIVDSVFDFGVPMVLLLTIWIFLITHLLFYFLLLFKDGQKHPNKYGESPKYLNTTKCSSSDFLV